MYYSSFVKAAMDPRDIHLVLRLDQILLLGYFTGMWRTFEFAKDCCILHGATRHWHCKMFLYSLHYSTVGDMETLK